MPPAARAAGGADASLPARLPLLLESARARSRAGRACGRRLGARVRARRPRSACCRCISRAASRWRGATSSQITASAHDAGLYTNLITSGIGLTPDAPRAAARRRARSRAGLDPGHRGGRAADRIAGYDGAHVRKRARRAHGRGRGPRAHDQRRRASREYRPHRGRWSRSRPSIGAGRVEIAHAQYYGWAHAQSRRPDADAGAGGRGRCRMLEVLRAALRRPAGDRRGRARLLCALPEALHGRLGAALAERDAERPGAALPRRGDHSGPRVLVGARITISPTSGRARRPSRRSGEPTGCRSRAGPARGATSISAVAAARRWRSRAMQPRPIRPAPFPAARRDDGSRRGGCRIGRRATTSIADVHTPHSLPAASHRRLRPAPRRT